LFGECEEALMKLNDCREKIVAARIFVKAGEWHLVIRIYDDTSMGNVIWAPFVPDS
jgi:hypothetical protein